MRAGDSKGWSLAFSAPPAPFASSCMGGAGFEMAEMIWAVLGLLVVGWAWSLSGWLWWKPKRLEHALKRQGLRGNPYRLLHGDREENARLALEASTRPMPLFSHDITPRVAPLLHKTMKEHGKILFTWLGPTPLVSLIDPKLIGEVLSGKYGQFEKPKLNPIVKMIVTGMVGLEGEKWAKHRRIVNPAFHLEKLKLMFPAFCTCCTELVSRWDKRIGLEGCVEIDVKPEVHNLTGDVISRTAFGSSYEEGRRIFQLQDELAEIVKQAFGRIYIPGYRFLPTSKNKRAKAIDREVSAILKGMIEKREKAIKMGESSKDDLLGLLIESNLRESEGQGNSRNARMTVEDIIAECKLFYFAGQDTSALLLTWTVIMLGMYPNWQARAREEVLQVYGGSMACAEGLSRLKIVTMILYEVLRLYPAASSVTRRSEKPMEVGGITYPPGVLLSIPIVFVHHDPDYWGEDANEFNPERFAGGVANAAKVQGAFIPFGGGPRICIGQSFALMEVKMALCMILQRFSFELSSSYIHAPAASLTIYPLHGAQIMLRKL